MEKKLTVKEISLEIEKSLEKIITKKEFSKNIWGNFIPKKDYLCKRWIAHNSSSELIVEYHILEKNKKFYVNYNKKEFNTDSLNNFLNYLSML